MQIRGKGNENLAVSTKFGWKKKKKKDINFNQFFSSTHSFWSWKFKKHISFKRHLSMPLYLGMG
jgi:hypothetical protein